jgi:exopolysaccharide production protein ExoQ
MFKYPALFLCLGFITWLVVRDCKSRPSVSRVVWIPTFFLLIIGSRPLSIWLGVDSGNGGESNPWDQVFFLATIGVSFLISRSRRVQWGKVFASNLPLLALYVFFAISVLWSADPLGSTKRLIKDFGLLFVISVMQTEKNPLEAIRAVYVRCACVLFPLSVVFIKYFPAIARDYAKDGTIAFSGVTMQKNALGEIVLVFTLFSLWDYLERRDAKFRWSRIPWDRLALLAMGLWLMHMSKSQTAFLCLIAGSALLLRRGWLASRAVSQMVLIGALALPFLLYAAQRFSAVIAPMVQALGRTMTFTGRANIWEHITAKSVNPLIGAGYWNFWGARGGLAIAQAMDTPIPNAHNGYLDIYLDGGLIGLGLLFLMLAAYGRRLTRNFSTNLYLRVRFALFIVMMMYNLSESMYFRMSPIWFTTLLVLVDFPFRKIQAKKSRKPLPHEEMFQDHDVPQFARQ